MSTCTKLLSSWSIEHTLKDPQNIYDKILLPSPWVLSNTHLISHTSRSHPLLRILFPGLHSVLINSNSLLIWKFVYKLCIDTNYINLWGVYLKCHKTNNHWFLKDNEFGVPKIWVQISALFIAMALSKIDTLIKSQFCHMTSLTPTWLR